MGKTLTEKIFQRHTKDEVKSGEYIIADVDMVMAHDTTCAWAIDPFEQIADRIWDAGRVFIPFDHAFPAPNVKAAKLQDKIRKFAKKYGLKITIEGVCHQLLAEKFVRPGFLIVGADSHTPTSGALGALTIGVGSTDAAVAMATGKCWFRVPSTIKINIEGRLKDGVFPKDVVLLVAGKIGPEGGNWKVLEYTGSTVENFSIPDRLTLTNMSAEMGAKAALVPPDNKTKEYLLQMGRETEIDFELVSDSDAEYEEILNFNVDQLEPMVACPHEIDNVCSIVEIERSRVKIDQVFIGSCTNCRIEDLEVVYRIFSKHKPRDQVNVVITPASRRVYLQALARGYLQKFYDLGITVTNPGCGACLGRHGGVLFDDQVCVSTGNRNFQGRMGSPKAEIYLASPATAAASAVAGYIKDPREFLN